VFVYFYRGLFGIMEERPTRRVYIEILMCRAIFPNLEESRSLEGAIFDKMLKEPCLYHKGGANHKLEDYRMLKKHFDGLGFKKDARDDLKKEKNGEKGDDKDDEGFPAVHDRYMIYGGPSTQLTARQRKRERREVFAARMTVPQYLNWSNTPITFDRDNHPDKVIVTPQCYGCINHVHSISIIIYSKHIMIIIYLEPCHSMQNCALNCLNGIPMLMFE